MKRIFLLDDDEFVTTLYKARLQNEGFQVELSNCSREALVRIEEWQPDLLVLDLHMPEFTGVDVLHALRSTSNTRLRTLPVVVLSNGHVQQLIDSVGSLGVQKIFVKMQTPPNVLIEGIKEVLQQSRLNVSLETAAGASSEVKEEVLPALVQEFVESDQADILHSLLLEIYKASWTRIRKGLRDDETTPRGKLSRALQKLIQDLYDNPEHITPSTKETLEKGLKKLEEYNNETLGSETALKNLLNDLGSEPTPPETSGHPSNGGDF